MATELNASRWAGLLPIGLFATAMFSVIAALCAYPAIAWGDGVPPVFWMPLAFLGVMTFFMSFILYRCWPTRRGLRFDDGGICMTQGSWSATTPWSDVQRISLIRVMESAIPEIIPKRNWYLVLELDTPTSLASAPQHIWQATVRVSNRGFARWC